jgi:hypothetical protein
MVKVREVYNYITSPGGQASIPLAPPSSSIGTTLTNTAVIENDIYTLYNNKKTPVGKIIFNRSENNFEDNSQGKVLNSVYLFDDGSYVMTLRWNSNIGIISKNTITKSISTGGKYAGKDVTVTVTIKKKPSDRDRKLIFDRKIIFEYEN